MRKVVLVAMAFFLVAAIGSAAPLCTDLSGPQNVASSGFSCTLGGLTFSNFSVIAAAGNPSPEVDLVSADSAGGSVNLTFNPNLSAPSSGGAQDLYLLFQVSGGVSGVGASIGGVNATMVETACSTAFVSSICPGTTLANFSVFSAGPATASIEFDNTDPIFLFKDIGVSPNYPNRTGGALTSFTESFTPGSGGGGPGGGEIPEPVSFILMGSGLVALSLLKRVRKV